MEGCPERLRNLSKVTQPARRGRPGLSHVQPPGPPPGPRPPRTAVLSLLAAGLQPLRPSGTGEAGLPARDLGKGREWF